jgi:tRNA dimethylallyltransferase
MHEGPGIFPTSPDARASPTIWLIAGPTASGKSAVALELAKASGGEIVNADSMQLYAELRVLTARPTAEDEARAAHHLFGVAGAGEAWSVGRWLMAALEVLGEIAARGRPAIVVGGTGLYFRALTVGLAAIPPVPAKVRIAVRGDYDAHGEAAFRGRLARVDPAAEARIAPGDRQRLTRAAEVFEASGRALTDWQAVTSPALAPDTWRGVVLNVARGELYGRIDARLEAMVAAGALAEVERLLARSLDPALPAMKALGVASFARQIAGQLSSAQALAEAQAETRRYAKRQITWFNHQCPDWPRAAPDAEAVLAALQG